MANTTNFTIAKSTVGGARNQWGGTLNLAIDKIDELLALALPVGTIQMYAKSTAPTQTTNGGIWLVCDGTAVSRTVTYDALFAVIGTTYGVGDGSTTFNIPDLRARVPVGYNTDTISGRSTRAMAAGSGTETHTLTTGELPAHLHSITDPGHPHNTTESNHVHSGTTGGQTLTVVDPGHVHTFSQGAEWSSGSVYDTAFDANSDNDGVKTIDSATTGISLSPNPHSHSFTADGAKTNLTIDSATTGITATNNSTGGGGAHNIMQPYQVVNYIILAAHPSF
tara:strand:+ start:386 stop:1225 length:840 start_codon:yes stop_codon:yes gene_type:complete